METSFTYVAGLDDRAVMEPFLASLLPEVTVSPSVNVFQSHTPLMDTLRPSAEAGEVAYFLQARAFVEQVMAGIGSDLVPQPWRCYRPLWYSTYAGRPLTGPRR